MEMTRMRNSRSGSGVRDRAGLRIAGWIQLFAALPLLGLAFLAAPPSDARPRGADGKFEHRQSSHFDLYQDVAIDRTSGLRGSRHFENEVLETLERAYDRLDDRLGLRPRKRMKVVIYDPQIFDHHFAGLFRFSAAGFYSGTIHIRGDVQVTSPLVRTLHHEVVHAAFDSVAPTMALPAWLNEGIAEWFEAQAVGKRQLSPREFRAISHVAKLGGLFSLWELSGGSFAGMGQDSASLAYLQSYAFVDYLARHHGERSLERLCDTLIRKRDLSRAFKSTYRSELEELEAAFALEYGSS